MILQAQKTHPEPVKAAWLHLKNSPEVIPAAASLGFKFQGAIGDSVLMYNWLLTGQDSTLPPPTTHQMGVSSVCLNKKGQILMVKDKGTLKFYGDYWKLPGGRVDMNEDLATASVREMWEETGIKTKFKSILGFRETLAHPNVALGASDMFYITRVELEDENQDQINFCTRELYDCQWVDRDLVGTEEFNVSAVGNAIFSVVDDGVKHGWDTVDISLKKFVLPEADAKKFKRNSFSFYRR